jgi:phosphocarrier protein FPr/phosphocarrier protein
MNEEHHVLQVGSPLSGWCASLDDSPDPVFSGRALGDGVSIDPVVGEVRAPFDGEVLTVPESRHAINLKADNGAEFLVHVGIDSVGLAGDGFEAVVAAGERVRRGQLLLKFDLEKVLRGATSLRTPVLLLQSGAFEIAGQRSAGRIDFGDALFEVTSAGGRKLADEATIDGPEVTQTVAVGLEHGIHARPAAALIEAIKPLDASVFCHYGDRPRANARSAVALMSLGVNFGDQVTVSARGQDADRALGLVVEALKPLDDAVVRTDPESTAAVEPGTRSEQPEAPADGAVIRAQPASQGLARGTAIHLGAGEAPVNSVAGSVENEQTALAGALEQVRSHLQQLAESAGGTGAEIAVAHLALLDDPMMGDHAVSCIEQGYAAPLAWQEAIDRAIEELNRVGDARMRERTDDLRDINLRVQRALAGEDPGRGREIPDGSIVLADNLLPSQLLELDRERVRGICLAAGGATSHVAILAISLEIPMLVAAGPELLQVDNGSELLLDGELGEITVRPDGAAAGRFEQRIVDDRKIRQAEQAQAHAECRTLDGVRIHFLANIGSAQEALAAVKAGAEGVGLLRTEFAFMDRNQAPDAAEQLAIYSRISDVLGPRPMVVRTLDAGGDKPINYIEQQAEENPALGLRGIRLGLENEALLETQLRALVELDRSAPLQVMIPMVSSVYEIRAVRRILDRLGDRLDSGQNPDGQIRLGAMVETPAAALIADRLAEEVDFFSIGTNDLTQYTLCMDRGEPKLAGRLDALHPAVLRLVRLTVQAGDTAGIPVTVCGGAAGDLLAAPVLLGLGARELSMPGSLIARQKARLRTLSMEICEDLAERALASSSAREVRAMMREFVLAQSAPGNG